jgi:hypothetical protein
LATLLTVWIMCTTDYGGARNVLAADHSLSSVLPNGDTAPTARTRHQ